MPIGAPSLLPRQHRWPGRDPASRWGLLVPSFTVELSARLDSRLYSRSKFMRDVSPLSLKSCRINEKRWVQAHIQSSYPCLMLQSSFLRLSLAALLSLCRCTWSYVTRWTFSPKSLPRLQTSSALILRGGQHCTASSQVTALLMSRVDLTHLPLGQQGLATSCSQDDLFSPTILVFFQWDLLDFQNSLLPWVLTGFY